jgi:hypothetical protein
VFPVIALAVAAVVLIGIYLATRRATEAGERPTGDQPTEQARIEHEFADAEAYQEEWRKEQHREHPPESLY